MPASIAPQLLPLLVGLPLVASVLCIFKFRIWILSTLSVLFSSALLLSAFVLIVYLKSSGENITYELAGWGAPLGINLSVNGFSSILLLMTAVIVLLLTFYSIGYFSKQADARRFWPIWWMLVAGINAAFIAADAFNIYVALEMIGMACVGLVAITGNTAALSAALRYAFVGLVGSLFYLLGVAILYRAHGTLDLHHLMSFTRGAHIEVVALVLISFGLILKTALFPLHFWLPAAHANSSAPVSAALSGLVVKVSFYLLIVFWFNTLSEAANNWVALFFGILGSLAIFYGCLAAFFARRLKLLVAYSTVAQIGYLFLVFPLVFFEHPSGVSQSSAYIAVVYFMVAHALAKSAMFLSAGSLLKSLGTDNMEQLKGSVLSQPLAISAFAIAGISLIGLPPSGGFIAKWLFLKSALEAGQWWWLIVMLGGGLMAALYVVKFLNLAFAQASPKSTTERPISAQPLPVVMNLSAIALAILAVVLGFNAEWIIEPLVENANQLKAFAG